MGDDAPAAKKGNLLKRGDWGAWTKRYFVVQGTKLLYFNNSSDANHRTAYSLKGAEIAPSNKRASAFTVQCTGEKLLTLGAASDGERDGWIAALRRAQRPDTGPAMVISERVSVVFGDGSLGLRLLPDNSSLAAVKLEAVAPDGVAHKASVRRGRHPTGHIPRSSRRRFVGESVPPTHQPRLCPVVPPACAVFRSIGPTYCVCVSSPHCCSDHCSGARRASGLVS